MDVNASGPYEFLDLTDIDENEKKKLISTLYKTSSTQADTKYRLKDSRILTSKKNHHSINDISSPSSKDFNNRNSCYINDLNKDVRNIATIKYPQQLFSPHVKTNAEQIKILCKPYSGNYLNYTTMAQHTQNLVNQPQQQPQPQHQPAQQQQQHLVNTQPQVQSNQSTQQALSQNNNYPPSHLLQAHGFNQVPPHPGGVYIHPHGSQPVGGAVYHMLSAASIPSSVYVHNVTANVNLHGYPVPPYIPGTGPTFIPGEVQQNVSHITEQNTSVVQNVTSVPVPRSQRRSRGRGNNGNNRRNDYNQRQQQPSPTPQEVLNSQVDPQTLGSYIHYGYPYSYFGTPPQNVAHPQAQQATGSPLYVAASPIPMFAAGPQVYGYPMIYHPTMISQEYPILDEKGEEHSEGVMPQMWSLPMYHEDYLGHELVEDVNHNPSPLTSSDSPSMLSPSYPMYDTQIQSLELQQQMNAMHIYEAQPLSQPLPEEQQQIEECQQHTINSLSYEQIADQSSLILGEKNVTSEQPIVVENVSISKINETNIVHSSYVPSHSEQNIQTINNSTEIQSVQQSTNNNVLETQQIIKDLPTAVISKDIIIKKDLNQNVPNSEEQQQISEDKRTTISTNEKILNNEDLNVPTVSENLVLSSNKTMSWVNQKKSTASVAVTATPSSTNKSSNINKGNNITHLNLDPTMQTVQFKNYGVMKTPSSPATTGESNINDRKTYQILNDSNKIISTSSIASTVVPQQFHEVKASNQIQLSNESKKENRNIDSSKSETSEPTVKEEVVNAINLSSTYPLSPPVSQGPLSWASLFANKSSTTFTGSAQNSSSSAASAQFKKPVAKVFPFEGTSNFPPPTTPGNMSYSAASAQGLISSQSNVNSSNVKMKSPTALSSTSIINKEIIDEWSLKFADFLIKYKIDYSPVSLRPRGLTNRSNYCYINAILQALIGCSPFYNLIKSIPKPTAILMSEKTSTPTIHAMIQLVSEFSHLPPGARLNRREKGQKKDDLFTELSCDPSFEPTTIYKLWNASRSDVEGRQEDAEEFLGYVLNKLNDEMLEVIKLISKPKSEQNGERSPEGDDGEDWQMIYNNRNKGSITRQTDFGRTPVSDIFRGELRSRLQREGEHSVTDVIQPFFTLQLNIEKAASVKEALEILVGRDQLEGVTCSKTNQEVAAWQQMTLEKLPVVLILHLKWFDYMDGCTKIFKTVEFPVELKIDTKILASKKYSQKQKLYRLFAVVYHDGKEASKGHYITDVYHTGYSSWLRYDDSSVKPVSENNVLRPRAPRVPYLLYYRRCDTVPVQNAANNK